MVSPFQWMRTNEYKRVMISSTVRDLPEHRQDVMDACLRQGMLPVMMEHLPASDSDAIAESLRMVDEADIYLGIFAFRYGYVPKGYDISLTEMEYNRAVEREMPHLIFLMHEDHPLKAVDVERGEGAVKLETFKARLRSELVVNRFKSSADLRADVINSLSHLRLANLTTFHYVSEIPAPPEPYVAHPYTLLQTQTLVGRQDELKLLTDWVTHSNSQMYDARILSILAIGGLGKSALTWKWFNDNASHEMQPQAGRMWWSFYESDATFENFIIRALAYVTGEPKENIQKLTPMERQAKLFAVLDREPYLVVLDGLERILIAYARMDAARLADDDLDQRTANVVVGAFGQPENATQTFTGQHRLRKTADPHIGTFLRKLASVRKSRILISTRLYPADLQTDTGSERSGCRCVYLRGLADDDALELWRAFGVSGLHEALLPMFHTFENHPLLIQALAGEVAHDRHVPGDFDYWRKVHPDFDPFSLPLVQVKNHILEFALRGLDKTAHEVLHTIAAFRMPAAYDTLAALLVGIGKPCSKENELVNILIELEDRGLLGWDRRANRYDLHPIVRGVAWSGMDNKDRRNIYSTLNTHFKSLPMVDQQKVSSLEDLTPTIELYNSLIGLKEFKDAYKLFRFHLSDITLYRLGAMRQRAELLEMLFPDGRDELPNLDSPADQAYVLNTLALSLSDQPERAAGFYSRAIDIREKEGDKQNQCRGLNNLSGKLCVSGYLHESEMVARSALLLVRRLRDQSRESHGLYYLGRTLALRGEYVYSAKALDRSLELARKSNAYEAYDYQAIRALCFGEYDIAQTWANRAMTYNRQLHFERGVIRAGLLQGEAFLGLGDLLRAEEHLHQALIRARVTNLVEEELPALIVLAEVRRRQGDFKAARELLEDVWETAERGPFPLLHADAYNVLAQIERDVGNHTVAVKAAMEAYRLAWCDGPPFAYYWGLQKAKAHLDALGNAVPVLPPFDASKYEPMPKVEIKPSGE